MTQVRWSWPAAEDLERICDERDNPEVARRVEGAGFPPHWPPSRVAGRRELVFSPLPYIVVYRVTEQSVEISRIFHGAQDWP